MSHLKPPQCSAIVPLPIRLPRNMLSRLLAATVADAAVSILFLTRFLRVLLGFAPELREGHVE
jgi:hypothetical protein